jgi:starvation-inducible outer membrane lipoprotein
MRVQNIWLLGALAALLVGCVAAPEGEDQSAMTESAAGPVGSYDYQLFLELVEAKIR